VPQVTRFSTPFGCNVYNLRIASSFVQGGHETEAAIMSQTIKHTYRLHNYGFEGEVTVKHIARDADIDCFPAQLVS
jgi:hypothetical protein